MAVATVTLVPIRILLISIFVFFAWILASIALAGLSAKELEQEPISGWRKLVL